MNWTIIGGIVGVITLITGGTIAFGGVQTEVAVHETRITRVEQDISEINSTNKQILDTLKTIVKNQEVTSFKIASSTRP